MSTDRRRGSSRAENALRRARCRARRALLLRGVRWASVVLLWTAAAALVSAGAAPRWWVPCGASGLLLILVMWIARTLGRRFVVVTVYGGSMEPAHHDGDRVMVRRGAVPVPGCVVVVERPPFESPWPDPPVAAAAAAHVVYDRQWVIKRVAAVAGDAVPTGALPASVATSDPTSEAPPDTVVPPGMLILLGDNAAESYDSRHVGYFPATRVLGTVVTHR
ncbi:signal peptidase I [Streptomyces sp. M41]|uniref:signal peptidase I n=1 Tax=Streptomyces sp. M41 TaxID=3059412 RepID=UPI00374DB0D6